MTLDEAMERIDERVRKRRQAVIDAFQQYMPEFPLDELRETFGTRVESFRSPTVNYGPPIERGIVPSERWIRPKPPKGDYPTTVANSSEAKRRFLNRLKRVGTACRIRIHGHQ